MRWLITTGQMVLLLLFTIYFLSLIKTDAFYIPGVHPKIFKEGDRVPLKVNAMTSIHTQLPKDYYRLPFCRPVDGPKMASENLGEFLTGNKIQTSPYTIIMGRDVECKVLCQVTLNKPDFHKLRKHIRYGYHNNWIIDNLPSASLGLTDAGKQQKHYAGGFPVGFVDVLSGDATDTYVYNHVNIMLDFHQPSMSSKVFRVVGFSVEPMSVMHKFLGGFEWDGEGIDGLTKPLETCPAGKHMSRTEIRANQLVEEGVKILYTYDVIWKKSAVAWSSRWDVYLSEDGLVPAQVHWFSITNSILVVLFLSLLVVSILVRNLRRDIASYNSISTMTDEEKEEEIDESGWKLIHADVFRPPSKYRMLYCVMVGSGFQISITMMFLIILSAVGFVNPARRGSLIITMLLLYMFFGSVAGFVSSRLYKTFRGCAWQLCTIFTATLFPGCCFFIFLFFNIILFFFHSSGSVPIIDILIVASMWWCVSIPLVYVGAYFGYKSQVITYPTETSTIPRAIPTSTFMLNPYISIIMAGLVPFAAAYVEFFFIMKSLWMDKYYYVFGFTFLVYIILMTTCAEVTILLVYYQLCSENHRWWWFAFFSGGSTAFYVFIYSIIWFRTLEASNIIITYMLYFGYMFITSLAIFLVTGMVGSISSLWFVRKMFSTIKVD